MQKGLLHNPIKHNLFAKMRQYDVLTALEEEEWFEEEGFPQENSEIEDATHEVDEDLDALDEDFV